MIRKIKLSIINIYLYFKHLPWRVKFYKLAQKPIKEGSIVIIVHSLEKTGAIVLGLNIIKKFREMNIDCVVISLRYGPLVEKISEICPLLVVSEKKIDKAISFLKSNYGCKNAICNTIVTGNTVKELKSLDYKVISLIHEMGSTLTDVESGDISGKIIAKYSDFVIFPSLIVKDSFLSVIGEITGKVIIRDQGIYNSYTFKESAKKAVEERYEISGGKHIILGIGTPAKRKGFDFFLETAYECLKSRTDMVFVWVGGRNRKIEKEIKKKYGIKEFRNVIFKGYIDSREELENLYSAASIFFLSSRNDPFPAVALDAMHLKVPVIAFEGHSGICDIVHDGNTGFLIKPFDIKGVKEKIEIITDDPALRRYLGENCYKESCKHNFNGYCAFLIKLMEKPSYGEVYNPNA